MRVLLANKYFFVKGGAERVYFDIDAALQQAGHTTIHFSMRDDRNRASPWSAHFVSNASYDRPALSPYSIKSVGRMFYSTEVRRAVRKLVREAKPDVAVLNNVYHQLGPALILELDALGVPSVMVLHDYKVVCPAYSMLQNGRGCMECAGGRFYRSALNGCGGSRARGIILAAESYWQWRGLDSYRRIGRFVAPSRFFIDTVKSMGFPFEIELLRNSVEAHDRAGDLADVDAVGFAGRMSDEKGVEVLLDAAAKLPSIPFRLAGDGPLLPSYRRRVSEQGLQNVSLLGHLPHDRLMREMATWRIAVVPSISVENCPLGVLEPFSFGIPVIGTNLGGTKELVEGRGVLVAPESPTALCDAVRALWPDVEKCRHLGSLGREFALEECSRAQYAQRLTAMLVATSSSMK